VKSGRTQNISPFSEKAATVILAMGEGRKAAASINSYLAAK
jgi:NADPH-dependent glutamate synthase beta subunit-like oxidoreductase